MKTKAICPKDYRRNRKEEILGLIDATIVTLIVIGAMFALVLL